jgi:hypothetical protein
MKKPFIFKNIFRKKVFQRIALWAIVLCLFSSLFTETVYAAAGVPKIINFQGRLLNSSGDLLGGPSGTNYCYKFALYDATTGGSKVWPSGAPSTMTILTREGVFNGSIGDVSAGGDTLDYDFQTNNTVYIDIQVSAIGAGSCTSGDESFESLTPRSQVVSAGYAINSGTVGGFTPAQSATDNQITALTSGALVLGHSTTAGVKATGSNALTFQSGVTGDIQFFSSSNKITSSGALTIAGLLTANGGLALGANNLTMTGSLGSTGARLTKGWFTDLEATNAIVGSITGSAATLTTPRAIYGNNFDGSAALTGIIASTYGGTGNGFTKFSGPTTAERTFTLPDSSATLLYSGGGLGTPASGVATNLTGTASGLTAGSVTNATLTTGLTVNTGTVTLTGNVANTSVLTIGAGAVSVSGSNTGDQTITLTGDVTGSGTGSFAATIAANSVALGTDTTGNYVAGATANEGLSLTGTEGGTLGIALTSSGTTGSVSSNSGLEVGSAGLTLLKGCTDNQLLKYTDAGGWACAADNAGGITDADYGDITVSSGVWSVDADAIALGTDTTGNYVSSATSLGGLTLTGTEGASLGFDYSNALSGDPALAANAGIFGTNGMIFEGSSADTFETFFSITNPTVDRTVTFPNASITVNAAADISGTTLASGVTGSSLTSLGTLTGLTMGGTLDANANIITNIGNAGTDFIASTGALTLAGVLTANGGVTAATGQTITASNFGLEFSESDTNPTCAAGNYTIYADTSEAKLKKCTNGVATDLDTTGGGSFDSTTIDATTWSDGVNASNIWTFDVSGTDHTMTAGNGLMTFGDAVTVTDTLTANGGIVIGAQADSAVTGSATASLNSAAGTFGSQANTDKVQSSVVFNGKLFVATAETDLAGVYRYDGGTTWTLVTNATPGKAVAGDTANIDAFVMTVHGDRLYIGSQTGASTGAVYYSTTAHTTADSFTLLNATRGTFASASQDGVSDMAVYNGDLIIATQEPNLAEIVRYTGGTTFTQINITDGKTVAETTADKDGHILEVFDGYLFVGSISGAATNVVATWNGAVSTPAVANWVNISVALTGGTYGDQTSMSDTESMVVHNGSLYVSMSKTAGNAAAVFRYTSTGLPIAATGATRFSRINTTVGKLIAGDAADQDSILLYSYNGRLYGGSRTGANTGALYEYQQTGAGAEDWVLMNTTRGTFGANASVDNISTMVAYNGTLYIGTQETNVASMYTWSKTSKNSYGLKFDSGLSNFAEISFVGTEQKNDNGGQHGTFVFSHAVSLKAGGFDYAEDYPTYDETLEPGDVVAIDSGYVEYIKRADGTTPAIGIYSKNPGMRLQKPDSVMETGERWVPVALVGRVPVKVSTENGPIKAGDSLTLSETIPGVAMKATKAGNIIARALGNYDSTEAGTVMAFIDNSYTNGDSLEKLIKPVLVDGIESATSTPYSGQLLLKQFMDEKDTLISNNKFVDIFADRIASGLEIITPTLIADTVVTDNISAGNGKNINILLGEDGLFSFNKIVYDENGTSTATTTSVITFDNFGNAMFKGKVTAGSIDAGEIKGLDIFTNKISYLSTQIASSTDQASTTFTSIYTDIKMDIDGLNARASSTDSILVSFATTTLEINDRLNKLELWQVGFAGFATTTDGFKISGNLIIQGGLEVDIIRAKEASTTIAMMNDIEFFGTPYFTKDTAGFATIYKNATSTEIVFDREYIVDPIVNTTITVGDDEALGESILESNVRFIVTKKTKKGFTIKLASPAKSNIPFSWTAFAVKDAKTFFSLKIDDVVIPVQEPESVPEEVEVPTPEPVAEEVEIPVSEPVAEEVEAPTPEPVAEEVTVPMVVPEPVPLTVDAE